MTRGERGEKTDTVMLPLIRSEFKEPNPDEVIPRGGN